MLQASTTYSADMIMPPMPTTEPGEEPPTSTGAASSTTPGHRQHAQSLPTQRQIDYIATLAQRLGRDVQQEMQHIASKADASVRIDQLLSLISERRQRAHL
eukprot:8218586-Heterocapsa_arctica.AAC.1